MCARRPLHYTTTLCYRYPVISKKLLVNTLCEFGPIMGFLVAFELRGFMAGVITMMIATVVALLVLRHIEKHTPMFALISSGTVVFFGGLSLFIDIPSIFILRDTFFDAIFGTILVISVWRGKPLFKYLFGNVFAITDTGWSTFSLRWGIFFMILALINEYVRHTFSPEQWVAAKILIIIVSVVFGTYQLTLTRKERLPDATKWGVVA
jgi:intracellular septation protein